MQTDEKHRSNMFRALCTNLEILHEMALRGTLRITKDETISVEVHYCGDEPWLRALLGLKTSGENYCCVKCLHNRTTVYDPRKRLEREPLEAHSLRNTGAPSQEYYPMIGGVGIWNLHSCGMHGLIAFGKDMVRTVQLYIVLKRPDIPDLVEQVDRWMAVHAINLRFEKLTVKELKLKVKATHTWILIRNWGSLMAIFQIADRLRVDLVRQLGWVFSVIYTWSFNTPEKLAALEVFRDTVVDFIKDWQEFMGRGKKRNYYHWLEVEVIKEIQHSGSIWAFACDVSESFVHVAKHVYNCFTAHGGLHMDWTSVSMERIVLGCELDCLDWKSGKIRISEGHKKKIAELYLSDFDDDIVMPMYQ